MITLTDYICEGLSSVFLNKNYKTLWKFSMLESSTSILMINIKFVKIFPVHYITIKTSSIKYISLCIIPYINNILLKFSRLFRSCILLIYQFIVKFSTSQYLWWNVLTYHYSSSSVNILYYSGTLLKMNQHPTTVIFISTLFGKE